jgi:hydrogenase maturation protein HypF
MTNACATPTANVSRLRLMVRGVVQGVGFRPFMFRLANELGLAGWVNNSPQGVAVELEGERGALENFLLRLEPEKPAHCVIQSVESSWLDAVGYDDFEIRESDHAGAKSALVLPDIATCPDCRREMFDPQNRRYLYPFINCTHCGPRFSIIESLPYDRANTSMRGFRMCPECRAEYENPRDRRFHAQPNACPVCGPHLELWSSSGETLLAFHEALLAAAQAIRRGNIVAVKGLGGFHLLVDARNETAVRRLRERKQREEKPFALMYPSLESVKAVCEVSPLEARLLGSPEAPIVLLRRIHWGTPTDKRCQWMGNENNQSVGIFHLLADSVAPGNPNLGVMLPSNPLQHLLMSELKFPVIATSGNLRDEPICTDEDEALERLRGIADLFLVHNRLIVRHVDDSIMRVMLEREMVLRRARGFAPLPVSIGGTSYTSPQPQELAELVPSEIILAVGAHLKNAVALAVDKNVFISQHIGDLETEPAYAAFLRASADLPRLYDVEPQIVAADLHPDYLSTKYADEMGGRAERTPGQKLKQRVPAKIEVQHHVAHVLSCIAENEVELPTLGVAWDGTGCGTDGSVWGGEFFRVTDKRVVRLAHFRPFRLPGGDKAIKEPRRVALGLLHELYGEAAFEMNHLPPLREMPPIEKITLKGILQRRFNSPLTSSVGRLFDAVASLGNLRQQIRFEGQAAMELEFACENFPTDEVYNFQITNGRSELTVGGQKSPTILDWSPMINEILSDTVGGVPAGKISAKFHNTLVEVLLAVARHSGETRVVLSGGCFQNRYLTERAVTRLREEHFRPYWHQRVPPNDGGIALGQIHAVRNQLNLQ